MENRTVNTIKVTENEITEYFYHGGSLRSHTLYSSEVDNINFSKMNMGDFELSCELERIRRILPDHVEAKVVIITVDKDMKYISEEGNELKKCRECGCTDGRACKVGCYWVEEDLCSTCHEKLTKEKTHNIYLLGYCDNEECSEHNGGWKYPHNFPVVDQQDCSCPGCGVSLAFIEQSDEI